MTGVEGREGARNGAGDEAQDEVQDEAHDDFQGTREEMERAIRRLDRLEWVILAFAVGVALLGGGAVAWVVSAGTELPFRATWAVLSVLLLAVPGILVFARERRRPDRGGDGSPRGTS